MQDDWRKCLLLVSFIIGRVLHRSFAFAQCCQFMQGRAGLHIPSFKCGRRICVLQLFHRAMWTIGDNCHCWFRFLLDDSLEGALVLPNVVNLCKTELVYIAQSSSADDVFVSSSSSTEP